MAPEVILPRSPDEAVAAFGDGDGVTVVGGGTILMPQITERRVRPEKVLMLWASDLGGIHRTDGEIVIGATTRVDELVGADEPLSTAAAHVADPEIRAQATLAGNLCAGPGSETPRGDLQAPLLALGARVRSTGAGGERFDDLDGFLAVGARGRLVLDVRYPDEERRAAHAGVHRPHSHHYTIMAVSAVRAGGETRLAVCGAGPHAVRLRAVESALAAGEPPEIAAHKSLDDVDPPDDALASAWYRRRVLPTVVARALADLEKENA
jgi:CO/xanthine dehydrogenase FAD-binding subunit